MSHYNKNSLNFASFFKPLEKRTFKLLCLKWRLKWQCSDIDDNPNIKDTLNDPNW